MALALNAVHEGDCLEIMREIPDGSINLIVIDPPYNIGKDKRWDKWQTVDGYVAFMTDVFKECERVLKPNGSFYWFHNDFLQIVELQNAINKHTAFIHQQFITWNKRFEGAYNKGFLDGFVEVGGLRNYQQMTEYCLFYTLQDEYGANKNGFGFQQLRDYFEGVRKYVGESKKSIIDKIGQGADHCFRSNSTQWSLPTREVYSKITEEYDLSGMPSYKEYDELLNIYNESRYTFNNQKTHHSVWNYEVAQKQGHITPKPVELIENILLHSSNEGDVVLDCFLGSGTTAVAAINTGRQFIGIEREPEYVAIANQRINDAKEALKV